MESKARIVLKACMPFVLAIVILQLVSALASIIIYAFPDSYMTAKNAQRDILLVATACMHATYILVFSFWYQKAGYAALHVQERRTLGARDLLFLLFAGGYLQIVVTLLLALILPLFPKVLETYLYHLENMGVGTGVFPLLVSVVMAPVAEELIFRGVTFSLAEGKLSFVWLNLLQAFLFGIYHMDVVQFFYAFGIGLILGLAYKKYHNLLACITLHASINLFAN
ncbi:MAG: CPBP family intramembrane metalloprotease, partial [Lachnospiraceae bacterium]|nr:CPBP family intramembrane metalloprotease [Lachnospiraceae bacterium]